MTDKLASTLPGFDLVIPKGQSASLNLLNEDDKFQNNFDPEIRWLKPHLDMQESELYFAVGPMLQAKLSLEALGVKTSLLGRLFVPKVIISMKDYTRMLLPVSFHFASILTYI